MDITSRVKKNGRYEITASQNEVKCTATMPTSAEAFTIAIRSCYQIISKLETLRDSSSCQNCDEG